MDLDLVYLWVDGGDPVWRAKKRVYSGEQSVIQDDAVGDCRYFNNDELKFSLRSVEKYAPWIRRIYIVTDGQCPAWLDTSNPRICIVDHREIVPEKYLPLFNSTALEYYISEIPGLSECFLYANDDMFFAAPVDSGFFFDVQQRPIVRLKKQSLRRHLDKIYPYMIFRAQQEIHHRYGKKYTLAPHHNIDAYRKSDFQACREVFCEEVERTSRSRFRAQEDLQRSILLYYALAQGRAVMRKVTRYNRMQGLWQHLKAPFSGVYGTDSRCIPVETPDPARAIAKYRPMLFCMNDGENTTADDRIHARKFLEGMFPDKLSFEK